MSLRNARNAATGRASGTASGAGGRAGEVDTRQGVERRGTSINDVSRKEREGVTPILTLGGGVA